MQGFDKLDRSHGSGARTPQKDFEISETYEHTNEFSKSRTTFEESDASDDRSRWKRLRERNSRKSKGEDSEFFRKAERMQDTILFCDILELNTTLREEVVSIVEDFNFDSKKYGKSYEKLLLVIINLVHDKSLGEGDSYKDRIIYEEEYEELMETVGLGATERQRLRQRVRESSDVV